MSHKAQVEFCKNVRRMYPEYFRRVVVADVGSMDINGNNRYLFSRSSYTGIDLAPGRNVTYVGHATVTLPLLVRLNKCQFDVIISTEALEHDISYAKTLHVMYECVKPGGLLLVTAAGEGREEHGTKDHHPGSSPFTNNYYGNITNKMFLDVLPQYLFSDFYISQRATDFRFFGIKKAPIAYWSETEKKIVNVYNP